MQFQIPYLKQLITLTCTYHNFSSTYILSNKKWFFLNQKDYLGSLSDLISGQIDSFETTDYGHSRHKSKISEKLGRCGRQNMLPPYLKIWDWDWIFGHAVKTISSLGVRSPWSKLLQLLRQPALYYLIITMLVYNSVN